MEKKEKNHRLILCYEVMQILKDQVVKIGCSRYSYKSAGTRLYLMFIVPLTILEQGSTKASFVFKSKRQPGDLRVCLCIEMQENRMCFKEKKQTNVNLSS